MKRWIPCVLAALLAGCGDHDHDHGVTDPMCARIEAACVNARNPAQMTCHDLAHGNNASMCSMRLNECLSTCGADASTPPG